MLLLLDREEIGWKRPEKSLKFEEAAQFWVYREYKYPTRNHRLSVFSPLGSKVWGLFRY